MRNSPPVFVFAAALATAAFSGRQAEASATFRFAGMAAPAAIAAAPVIADGEAAAVVDFWKAAGEAQWFAKDAEFDRRFRERFLMAHEAAARGELMHWRKTAEGAMALIILLDQFPRNAFRGSARMYATDGLAREVAAHAIDAGHDRAIGEELRPFFVMPFGHSENLADQERSVALARDLGDQHAFMAEHHRDIIRRFGRFPHRNAVLGRQMTKDEREYMEQGGFAG